MKTKLKGFTLIELLVVIAIIGIHPNRATCGDCHHRDTCGHAAAGPGPRQGQGQPHEMREQHNQRLQGRLGFCTEQWRAAALAV